MPKPKPKDEEVEDAPDHLAAKEARGRDGLVSPFADRTNEEREG